MLVRVGDDNIDQVLRVLKKKMQREGIFREMRSARRMKSRPGARLVKSPMPSAVPVSSRASGRSEKTSYPHPRRSFPTKRRIGAGQRGQTAAISTLLTTAQFSAALVPQGELVRAVRKRFHIRCRQSLPERSQVLPLPAE